MATTDVVQIEEFDHQKGDDKNTVVVVKLRNSGDAEEERTVHVVAKTGGTRKEETKTVSVTPGVPKTVKLAFDIPYKKFRKNADLTVEFA